MASSTVTPSAGNTLSPEPLSFSRQKPRSFVSIPGPRIKPSPIRATADYSYLTARQKVGVLTDNLDGWMRESVAEIVKSLKNSPLMVYVYCNESTEVQPSDRDWREGERRSPDGIILVQQLVEDDNNVDGNDNNVGTKAWGVLIQGKGMGRECTRRTACYLLKTCRVHSGLGLCGTHFSLVKVNNFRESAFSQFKNSWLL